MESYLNQILESRYLRFTVLRDGVELPDITDLTCRPELARTLRRIADRGAVDFYRGEIAGEISTDMKQRGGYVRQADLGVFRIREIEAVRGTYRGLDVLSFPWPGSGKAVVHALNILENFSPAFLSQDTVDRYQTTAESFHIAIEDFHRYSKNGNVDPANIGFDYATKEFAAERARLIRPGPALKEEDLASTDRHTTTEGNTTQVSVVDRFGNAISLTQTLGRFFGAKVATPGLGFPYNNLLEGDTALRPRTALPTAMAPTIVVEDGEVLLVLGSAGSDRIPGVIASIISNVVDRSANLGEAVSSPRILWGVVDNPGAYLEIHPPITGSQVDELEARGYEPVFRAHLPTPLSRLSRFGAVNAVHLDRHTRMMTGVADPRRFGFALGAEF
jgi:gamma-glutamyltranspeptidase/glutathione hydrolase